MAISACKHTPVMLLVALVATLGPAACANPGTDVLSESVRLLPEFEPLHPDDRYYDYGSEPNQWSLAAIAMPRAWGTLFAGEVARTVPTEPYPREVVVAVLDTAVDTTHPDLTENLVAGYDFVSGGGEPGHGSYADHGSHMAGIIGARTDNEIGIAGVGWNVIRVMPVVVLDSDGSGDLGTLIDGLMFAAGLAGDGESSPDRPAAVISLSLGVEESGMTNEEAVLLESVLADVTAEGITVVAAAGNQGCAPILYPAAYPTTVAVGSANPPNAERAGYSNCGDTLDLVAPGGSGLSDSYHAVFSLSTGGGESEYGSRTGTSVATAHVSGVAALLYAASENMNPGSARAILRETATPAVHAGDHPNDEYGWGMLNAGSAVRRALIAPYGPYTGEVTASVGTSVVQVAESGAGVGEVESSESRRLTEPPEGTYRSDRVLLALDRSWYSTVPRDLRRTRLRAISGEYGLAGIVDRGHRFPIAMLPDGHKLDRSLLSALLSEPEIESVSYDFYTKVIDR